jgi:hypothetical protein
VHRRRSSRVEQTDRSKLHRILTQGELKPHKIRYYVERRDPEFERKMVEVLHVYKEVEIINGELLKGSLKEPPVVTISYDEKLGIQALATTTPESATPTPEVCQPSAGQRIHTIGDRVVAGRP